MGDKPTPKAERKRNPRYERARLETELAKLSERQIKAQDTLEKIETEIGYKKAELEAINKELA